MTQLPSLENVSRIAQSAGQILMAWFGRLENVELKGSIDLVTDADRAAEAHLVEALGTLFPEAAILAEEGSGHDTTSAYRWLVDPLDGTTNFAHGYPVFCVSLGLEFEGEVVLGVVHDPTRNETFAAERGQGATLNGEPLAVGKRDAISHALLMTGFPYDVHHDERNNLGHFMAFMKQARALRRDGSAALNLAYVAAGRVDGYWEEKLNPWDLAAGSLLVTEAGGCVSDYAGGATFLVEGNVVAANPELHRVLLEQIQREEQREPKRSVGWSSIKK